MTAEYPIVEDHYPGVPLRLMMYLRLTVLLFAYDVALPDGANPRPGAYADLNPIAGGCLVAEIPSANRTALDGPSFIVDVPMSARP